MDSPNDNTAVRATRDLDEHTITAGKGRLSVGVDGLSLTPAVAGCPASRATGGPFWTMTLEPDTVPAAQGEAVVITSLRQDAVRREALPDGGARLVYERLTDGGRVFSIALTLEFRASGDGFTVTGSVTHEARGWRMESGRNVGWLVLVLVLVLDSADKVWRQGVETRCKCGAPT